MSMNRFCSNPSAPCRGRQGGISLIIVLIMLVIIGLTSAAAIRNATSDERVTNNVRMQNLAQQYADAALRYCEAELSKADADRVTTLQEANLVQTAYQAAPAWDRSDTWIGAGGASGSRTTVPELQIKSSGSSFRPTTLPQCVAEKQVLEDAKLAYVVTARGFSPDYTADAGTGATTGGSVVWLQSTLVLN
jgi:type IV pilus assembly protein PilX